MKKMISILIILAVFLSFGTFAFAETPTATPTATPSTSQSFNANSLTGNGMVFENSTTTFSNDPKQAMTPAEASAISQAGVPNVSMDQASSYFERKGFELIKGLQRAVQPLAIIIFIISAIMTLFGAFGNGSLVGKGIVGMIISLIVYAFILYAPELFNWFMSWVHS